MNKRPPSPITKGDRVSHYSRGEGNVDYISHGDPSRLLCRVEWDNHQEVNGLTTRKTWEPEWLLNIINHNSNKRYGAL